jgi:DNA polymerase-1
LQQFGSIDNLLANTNQLKGALQRKVQEQVQEIRFSRFLATIKTDVPIVFDEQSLVCQERNWEQLAQLYRDLEFNSLLKQAPKELLKPAPKTTKKVQEATLDLFASMETPSESLVNDATTRPNIQIEERLAAYLLNPELAFNPNIPVQWDALQADSALWALYQDVELPLVQVLKEMEQEGVRVDVDMLRNAEKELTIELNALEQQVYHLTNKTFNINSPKQVGEILFDELKLDSKHKKSKSGSYSTSEEVLLSIKDKHPVVGLILTYRELKKLISTYIAALPTYINPTTGKIHTTYNQTTTATGRLSSSNPNLQNLPIRSERGQLIRRAVIPDEGYMFLSADYSQIELRLMAHFSQDPHLLHAFHSGQDIHAATAAKIFGIPIEQVTKEQRRQAKTANFGIIYGISAFGLSQQLDCSRTEAKALIDGYFAAFPGVIDFIERQKELARNTGYAITLFGRKRYLPDILSRNATVRSFAERNAVNSPIQGTAADIIKMAMVTINRRLKEEGLKAKMIMQVHDELNFNVPMDEVERVKQIVVNEMQNVVHLSIPLIADCGVGKNWFEAH